MSNYTENWPEAFYSLRDPNLREARLLQVLSEHPDSAEDKARLYFFRRRFGEGAGAAGSAGAGGDVTDAPGVAGAAGSAGAGGATDAPGATPLFGASGSAGRTPRKSSPRVDSFMHAWIMLKIAAEGDLSDDNVRIVEYSTMTLEIMHEFVHRLQAQKVSKLEKNITTCFEFLAQKQ